MGRTGLAGDRHLHFSLHFGEGNVAGANDTVPINDLIAQQMGSGRGFESLGSRDFLCSPEGSPWAGMLHGSENDGARRPTLGSPTDTLATLLDDMQARISESVDRRQGLWDFAEAWWIVAPEAAEAHLEGWQHASPEDPVARYYWATEVEMPKGHHRAARASLLRVMELASEPDLYDPWLIPWAHNRLGSLELSLGHREAAAVHFRRASDPMPSEAIIRYGELKLRATDEALALGH